MNRYVVDLRDVDDAQVAPVGGKGASLRELARIDGIRVPAGFCITTDAYRVVAQTASIGDRLDRLSSLSADDHDAIRLLAAEIRSSIEQTPVPDDVLAAISSALVEHGEHLAYAVRSSATAEDSPTASFAGQHDSYLRISGPSAILEHIRRCWASLFTDRAVTYRLRGGADQRTAQMAVVVQHMVAPNAAGVVFTADPLTSNRTVASVEAVPGLADGLVTGLVNPDRFAVRDGAIVTRSSAIAARPALSDSQVVELVGLARRIEAHFGSPQDIEWCLDDEGFHVVQSRSITALFPVPDQADQANHVYVSVGHQQMMTDAMTPLGISIWQLTTLRPMAEAGGRLFVDVTQGVASPASRDVFLETLGRADPLIRDALQTLLDRGDFIAPMSGDAVVMPTGGAPATIETDPAIPTAFIERFQASLAAAEREIETVAGSARFEFILADLQELRRMLFDPESLQVITAAMDAAQWINEHMHEWLGVQNAADPLTQSVPNNVTSEMGLALLDVADVVRRHPDVVAFLREVEDDSFLVDLVHLAGGDEVRAALEAFLDRYGMRCVGEIDIARPRWRERPTTLVPLILANGENFEPGEAARRFEQGRRAAWEAEHDLLERLGALADGSRKADETKQMIDRLRAFMGYREYPKYLMISRYFIYKRALMVEAERLVEAGVLDDRIDACFLRFEELHEAVRRRHVDHDLIDRRKSAFESYQALTPPRVLTSEGEAIVGSYRRDDVPTGALVGLGVSAGVVEGRARVILDLSDADVEPGDILVTAFTDPSWAPLFVSVAAMVTEVGGLMTHGAVVAREYGLPAVVGVDRAAELIEDGQRIRVDGSQGTVEIVE